MLTDIAFESISYDVSETICQISVELENKLDPKLLAHLFDSLLFRSCRDRMVVGFITNVATSAYHVVTNIVSSKLVPARRTRYNSM